MALSRTCGVAKINSIQMLSRMARVLHMEGHLAGLICLTTLTVTSIRDTRATVVVVTAVVVAVSSRAPDEVAFTMRTRHSLLTNPPPKCMKPLLALVPR